MHHEARPRLHLVAARPEPLAPAARTALLVALAAVGIGQLLLGVAQIAGLSIVDMVDGGHVGNESAAWNIAIGTALLGIVRARRCPATVFIMLTAFVAVLTLTTAIDALQGHVGPARIATHLLVLTGYLLVVVIRQRQPGN